MAEAMAEVFFIYYEGSGKLRWRHGLTDFFHFRARCIAVGVDFSTGKDYNRKCGNRK